MANKVYIPNLVINEISDSLIDQVADQVGNKLVIDPNNLAKLDQENTFLHAQTIPQVVTNGVLSANKLDIFSTDGIDISSRGSNRVAQVIAGTDSAGIRFNEKMIAIGHDGPDMSTPADIIMSHTPTIITPTEWATMTDNEVPTKKQILDNIQGGGGGGDSIPLSISNQIATYDTTTLNSVKWDFGNDTYSILGTNEIDFTTKTSRLDKTSNVIIGDAGCYAIPDELIPLFGDSLKEMGSIPIGLNVMSSNSNVGGLGIGGNGNASVLWGGGGRNFLAITMDQVILSGDSASGNAGLSIVNGVVIFNSPNSFNFNLGDSGTLTMSPKMISELKRLLGIS